MVINYSKENSNHGSTLFPKVTIYMRNTAYSISKKMQKIKKSSTFSHYLAQVHSSASLGARAGEWLGNAEHSK